MGFRIISDEDRGFEAFFENLREADGARVRVGIQGDEASEIREGGISMVQLGVIHEFGAPKANVPQRSFIRSTADVNKPKYEQRLEAIAKRIVKRPGAVDVRGELFKLGERVRKDIINRIRKAEIKQDLAESTKKAKARKAGGKVEPALIDEGLLIGSISSTVT